MGELIDMTNRLNDDVYATEQEIERLNTLLEALTSVLTTK